MKYIKTCKQLNEGLLPGKSLDRIEREMEGKTDNEKIDILIKNQGLHKLLPRNENGEIVYDGDLVCSDYNIFELPDGLVVNGNLCCINNKLKSLPNNLVVNSSLDCSNDLTELSEDLVFEGGLNCSWNSLESLPDNLIVNGYFNCIGNELSKLPDGLVVNGDLDCREQSWFKLEIPSTAKISGKIRT